MPINHYYYEKSVRHGYNIEYKDFLGLQAWIIRNLCEYGNCYVPLDFNQKTMEYLFGVKNLKITPVKFEGDGYIVSANDESRENVKKVFITQVITNRIEAMEEKQKSLAERYGIKL